MDKLLYRKAEKCYPTAASAEELANTFAVDFFYNKIDMIRNELSDKRKMVVNRFPDNQVCSTEFVEFQSVSESQVKGMITSLHLKSCNLDLFPASIMKGCTIMKGCCHLRLPQCL